MVKHQTSPNRRIETPILTITLKKNLDWGFIGLVAAGALWLLLIFGMIRIGRSKTRHYIIIRNEICSILYFINNLVLLFNLSLKYYFFEKAILYILAK